ncbi:MAG: T9SS type A sorting domain-containing protein [Prolixibacteraceae bacterium]|nr:T9SS type A sorting domain-containing protein [Prolixibacteraceae bacterium]
MKKNLILTLAILITGLAFISSVLYNSASPGAKTGSPIDKETCAQCHTGALNPVEWISTNIPAAGYVSGEKYTVTLSASDAAAQKIGFEITAESAGGKQANFVITDDTKTKLVNGNKSVTHKSAGITPVNGSITWSFDWIAPAAGTGDVTFYAAINAANGNGSTSGDKIYTSKLTVAESKTNNVDSKGSIKFNVYPNPAKERLNIESESIISSIVIYDLNGKIVLTQNNINSNRTAINIENIRPGIHLVKTITQKGEFTNKIQLN